MDIEDLEASRTRLLGLLESNNSNAEELNEAISVYIAAYTATVVDSPSATAAAAGATSVVNAGDGALSSSSQPHQQDKPAGPSSSNLVSAATNAPSPQKTGTEREQEERPSYIGPAEKKDNGQGDSGGGGNGGGALSSSVVTQGSTSASTFAHPLDAPIAKMTPLELAVTSMNEAAVSALLSSGATADAFHQFACTPLCKCCYAFSQATQVIKRLLEAGANPDATTNNDTESASCLIISVVKNNVDVVKMLLEYGADVAYEWKGHNALAMALDFKKLDVVELLENHEFKRAQANRWKRYNDRRILEEQREKDKQEQQQQEASAKKASMQVNCASQTVGTAVGGSGNEGEETEGVGEAISSNQPPPRSPQDPSSTPQKEPRASDSVHVLRIGGPDDGGDNNINGDNVGAAQPQPQSDSTCAAAIEPHDPESTVFACTDSHHSRVVVSVAETMSSMDWLVERKDLEIIRAISSGAHGDIYEGLLISTGDSVAVKRFHCNDERSRKLFQHEATLLSRFRHENIVMFKGAVVSSDLCCVLSELCVENLLERLERQGSISWSLRLTWARDIAKAMTYLHTRTPPVVHRDLKSLNILLDFRDNVKICDFGMSRLKQHTYIATQNIAGSPAWMAPEVLRGDDFNDNSDVYAFGVILWELLTRRIPWPDKNMAQLVGLVGFSGARLEIPDTLPSGCPAEYAKLIRNCWEEPTKRPSFKQLRVELDKLMCGLD